MPEYVVMWDAKSVWTETVGNVRLETEDAVQ